MVMASDGVNMLGRSGDFDPAASQECHLCWRRRFTPRCHPSSGEGPVASSSGRGTREKRRRPVQSPPASASSSSSEGFPQREEGSAAAVVAGEHVAAEPVPEEASTAAEVWPVAFGSVSMAGQMQEMEDAVSLRPAFCTWADGSPMHFFAVFDGHGGPHVSALCREQMHVILAEELAAEAAAVQQQQQTAGPSGEEERAWRAALSRSFARVDSLAAVACACGRAADPPCRCPLSGQMGAIIGSTAVVALLVGNRVVVANCGDSRAVLCRAGADLPLSDDQKGRAGGGFKASADVLRQREERTGGGVVLPVLLPFQKREEVRRKENSHHRVFFSSSLSSLQTVSEKTRDLFWLVSQNSRWLVGVVAWEGHQPDRPDEKERIEAAGGRVVYLNGPRVRGILAMSRALGDRFLKPEVICEPEITVTERTVEDDCLILASDGMWDVISNKTACDVARHCLEDGSPSRNRGAGGAASSSTATPAAVGQQSEPRCYRAAALLARIALGRESSDNISVVVIDLKGRG